MADGGQQGGPQALGLGQELGRIDVVGELDAVDGERGLVQECIEQPALRRSQERPGQVLAEAGHAELAAAGAQRQEQARCSRKIVRAAAGGRVVAPAPFRRGEVVVVELVLGRVGGQTASLPSSGSRNTTSAFSITATWWAAAQSRSSIAATPLSFLAKA